MIHSNLPNHSQLTGSLSDIPCDENAIASVPRRSAAMPTRQDVEAKCSQLYQSVGKPSIIFEDENEIVPSSAWNCMPPGCCNSTKKLAADRISGATGFYVGGALCGPMGGIACGAVSACTVSQVVKESIDGDRKLLSGDWEKIRRYFHEEAGRALGKQVSIKIVGEVAEEVLEASEVMDSEWLMDQIESDEAREWVVCHGGKMVGEGTTRASVNKAFPEQH